MGGEDLGTGDNGTKSYTMVLDNFKDVAIPCDGLGIVVDNAMGGEYLGTGNNSKNNYTIET